MTANIDKYAIVDRKVRTANPVFAKGRASYEHIWLKSATTLRHKPLQTIEHTSTDGQN